MPFLTFTSSDLIYLMCFYPLFSVFIDYDRLKTREVARRWLSVLLFVPHAYPPLVCWNLERLQDAALRMWVLQHLLVIDAGEALGWSKNVFVILLRPQVEEHSNHHSFFVADYDFVTFAHWVLIQFRSLIRLFFPLVLAHDWRLNSLVQLQS